MDTIDISPEQFQQALSWINGQASTLGEQEVLQMLRTLTGRFQENCRALRPGPVPRFRNLRITPHPLSLTAIAAEVEAERETAKEASASVPAQEEENPFLKELMEESASSAPPVMPAAPPPPTPEQEVIAKVAEECRLDSVHLINAIAYVGGSAGYHLSQPKAQMILYCLYGSRLGAGEERLPIEHPQMWKYGPVFPRAFKRGNIEDRSVCEDSFSALLESDPMLVAALSAKTQSMMATPMADLNVIHKGAQSPYGRTKARFPEKWGVQIPDEEIAMFFRSRMTG